MNFKDFKDKISRQIDVDLNSYKEKRVKRRVNNLMKKNNLKDYQTCLNQVSNDNQFKQDFLEHMTINTSEFFRNPANFEYLKNKILPSLLDKKNKIKIWSAASSNGCEAHTVAIILNELGINPNRYELKATDIDPSILKEAKAGKYKKNALKKVDDRIISKYFTKTGDYYQLDRKIMSQVKFGKLNLLEDRYDRNIDLILCRNVFIYFTKPIKDELTAKLSDSLVNDGILFLGNTEYLLQPSKFNLEKIYTSFYQKI